MKRLTRDQEIDLMVKAPARLEASMAKWMKSDQIREAIQRPSNEPPKGFDKQETVKRIVRCA